MDGRRQIHLGDLSPYLILFHASDGACRLDVFEGVVIWLSFLIGESGLGTTLG